MEIKDGDYIVPKGECGRLVQELRKEGYGIKANSGGLQVYAGADCSGAVLTTIKNSETGAIVPLPREQNDPAKNLANLLQEFK